MHSNFKIFSGTSNIPLSNKIALNLGTDLSDVDITRFQDGEISVQVKEDVRSFHCFVVQSLCKPVNDNLMELLIIIDALKRSYASRITAVIPYLGYSRQDRRCRLGEPITAHLVSRIISNSGIDEVIVVDLHASQIEGFFDVPVSNVSNFENFANDIRKIDRFDSRDFVLVAPDVGAAKKTRYFSQVLGCDMAIVDKHRSKANYSEVMNIIGNINSKNIILVDDIIDTAGTISNAAESLVKKGNAKEVYIYATHAVCSGKAFKRLSNPCIKEVIFSDSISISRENINSNIRILSIANTLSKEISKRL